MNCAQAIACQIEDAHSGAMLTLEQTFQGIVEFSRAKAGRGRPTLNASRVREKPTGRADIVLWNRGNTPRAIIEIKRQPGKDGLLKDAQRVIDFAKSDRVPSRGVASAV